MNRHEKEAWRSFSVIVLIGVVYTVGIVFFGTIDLSEAGNRDWRSFMYKLIAFAVIVHVVLYYWVDRDAQKVVESLPSTRKARRQGDRWGFIALAWGLSSCLLLLINPSFSDSLVKVVYHALAAILWTGFAVKFAGEIVFHRRLEGE